MFLPLAAVSALEGDQIVDVAIDEELANTGDIRPLATVLREIVCAKGRTHLLVLLLRFSPPTPEDRGSI